MTLAQVAKSPLSGLILVIAVLSAFLALAGGTVVDPVTGTTVNKFLNPGALLQLLTDTSFFTVLAIGVGVVMLTGGIDLSIGSTYALSGVLTAMVLRNAQLGATSIPLALALCLLIGLACGSLNGVMVAHLGVHPFVITLGTMWIFRGVAFVASKAESLLFPMQVTEAVKSSLGLRRDLHPIPVLVTIILLIGAAVFLAKTSPGRKIYSVGGNVEAANLAGIRVKRTWLLVYTLCGLCAGLAAFLGASYYGSASCSDGTGYELYAIASAVVGGISLNGGRGVIAGAGLGALLIMLFRQGVVTLSLDTKYEWIIIGVAIIIAVLLDKLSRKRQI
ncbi:MAG: ABC transporter permease [Chthonomonadaceae bacterium]|nr:ABC transporter permease [Chthonomonadaceae bacterium]